MSGERDIRTEQIRAGISDAWRIWNDGKNRLDSIREQFNYALKSTQKD